MGIFGDIFGGLKGLSPLNSQVGNNLTHGIGDGVGGAVGSVGKGLGNTLGGIGGFLKNPLMPIFLIVGVVVILPMIMKK